MVRVELLQMLPSKPIFSKGYRFEFHTASDDRVTGYLTDLFGPDETTITPIKWLRVGGTGLARIALAAPVLLELGQSFWLVDQDVMIARGTVVRLPTARGIMSPVTE
jgi:hypothetical protein